MGGGTLMAAGVGGWNIAIMNPPRHSHLYSSAYFPNPGSYNYSNKTHHQHRSVGCKAAGHQPAKKSSSDEKWVAKGVITESLPNGMFWVRLENNGVGVVLGYVSGKIRRNSIRMLPGDCVNIELTRYDSTRGRIVYRLPSTQPNNHPAAKHS